MLGKLSEILLNNNVYTEIDDLEYHNGYREGIVIPFSNGECLQIFYDEEFIVIDENLCEYERCNSEHVVAIHIINYYENKIEEINNGEYLRF